MSSTIIMSPTLASSFLSFAFTLILMCVKIPYQLFIQIPFFIISKLIPILVVTVKDASPEPLYSYLDTLIKRHEEGESVILFLFSSVAPYLPLVSEIYMKTLDHLEHFQVLQQAVSHLREENNLLHNMVHDMKKDIVNFRYFHEATIQDIEDLKMEVSTITDADHTATNFDLNTSISYNNNINSHQGFGFEQSASRGESPIRSNQYNNINSLVPGGLGSIYNSAPYITQSNSKGMATAVAAGSSSSTAINERSSSSTGQHVLHRTSNYNLISPGSSSSLNPPVKKKLDKLQKTLDYNIL